MRGYQAIPSAPIDSIEDGAPSDCALADGCTSNDEPSPSPSLSAPSLASKLVYISLGIAVGCISSIGILKWSPVAGHDNAQSALVGSSTLPVNTNTRHGFLINGKSFLDSLPFEEVIPSSWNPAEPRRHDPLSMNPSQPHPHQEKKSHHLYSSSSLENNMYNAISKTMKDEETNLLSVSLLRSNIEPIPSLGPHLLYHAHGSSFGLLYDSSKSYDNYLSEYSLDYFLINSGGFDAQINQAYCAVATVATILNSLKYKKRFREGGDLSGWSFDLPIDPRYDPYPYATQRDILAGDCVWNEVIEHGDGTANGGGNVDGIFKPPYGLSLEQSGKLLKCHVSDEWEVTVQQVDPSQITLSRMRYALQAALIDPDARVMINYDRKGLGQVGGGHFSPLGAYHAATDSFLVVDVAKYKYPPVWVGADTLFSAMATVDRCGTWDYPKGQEKLGINTSDGKNNKLFNPITPVEYAKSLDLLKCEQRMRGYIILKKKA